MNVLKSLNCTLYRITFIVCELYLNFKNCMRENKPKSKYEIMLLLSGVRTKFSSGSEFYPVISL